MKPTTSCNISDIEETIRDAVLHASSTASAGTVIVVAVHPRVDIALKSAANISQDAELRGVAGAKHVMVTESVPGARVIQL